MKICSLFIFFLVLDTSVLAQSIVRYAPDPQGGIGFNRAHWASSINKMVVLFGTSGPGARGDNSVRAFDPVKNNWEYLWPNSNGASGLQNRDNHGSFYVSRRDEIWVWGGSHLETLPPGTALLSGRFNVSQKKWVATSTNIVGAFAGVVKNFASTILIDPAMAWAGTADTGLIFGGSQEGNASNRSWIVAPNPGGPEPYVMTEITGGGPPPRDQVMNSMVSDGTDFYLFGGHAQISIAAAPFVQSIHRKDLWKFSTVKRTWTQLADAPRGGYQSTMTYDSDRNALIAYVEDRLLVYDISTSKWFDQTPANLACVGNQVGAYSPTAKVHIFEGGNDCVKGHSLAQVLGIQLSGQARPQPMSPRPSPSRQSNGWLDIPLRTWVSRPLPPVSSANAPLGAIGFGPGGPLGSGQAKHLRLQYVPDTKKLYINGGSYTIFKAAGLTGAPIWSYDITKPDLGNFQNWKNEWPYCGLNRQPAPAGITEVPWAWDSKRKVFWLTGGFSSESSDPVSLCNGYGIFGDYYGNVGITSKNSRGTAQRSGGDILQFNPATNRWTRPDSKYTLPPHESHFSVYNPTTDEIIIFGSDPQGSYARHMNADTGLWTRYGLVTDSVDRSYLNDTALTHETYALDVQHQFIYYIDVSRNRDPNPNLRFRLMRYSIKTHSVTSLGFIPMPNADKGDNPGFCGPTIFYYACFKFPWYHGPGDTTVLLWDSINQVLLFPATNIHGRPILLIGHVDPTGVTRKVTWEVDPMKRDKPMEVIFGNSGTFIPELNVLVIYGGFGSPHDDNMNVDCPKCKFPMNYFWLYRYGNGAASGAPLP